MTLSERATSPYTAAFEMTFVYTEGTTWGIAITTRASAASTANRAARPAGDGRHAAASAASCGVMTCSAASASSAGSSSSTATSGLLTEQALGPDHQHQQQHDERGQVGRAGDV